MFFPRFPYAVFIFSDDSRHQCRQFAAQHCFPHCCEGKNILTRAQGNLSRGVALRLPSDGRPQRAVSAYGGRQSSYFVSSPTKVVLTRAEKNGAATGGLKERETASQHPGSSSPQITAQVTTQKWVKANLAGQRITKEVGLIN